MYSSDFHETFQDIWSKESDDKRKLPKFQEGAEVFIHWKCISFMHIYKVEEYTD